jgi:hypothetical protein
MSRVDDIKAEMRMTEEDLDNFIEHNGCLPLIPVGFVMLQSVLILDKVRLAIEEHKEQR